MIVGHLDVPRGVISPHKAEPPLIVDADTVLTLTVAAQSLKVIAGRYAKIVELFGGINRQKLRACAPLNLRRKSPHSVACKDRGRALVREAPDHDIAYRETVRYVNIRRVPSTSLIWRGMTAFLQLRITVTAL